MYNSLKIVLNISYFEIEILKLLNSMSYLELGTFTIL